MKRRWLVGLVLPLVSVAVLGWAQVSVAQEAKKPDAKQTEPKKESPKKEEPKKEEPKKEKDIVDTAMAAPNCKTLCELLKAAGLVETLKGKGPFTVFAPDDAAFEKLGKATLDEWKKPENKEKLAGILKYHVLASKSPAADVAKMKTAKTVNGKEVTITTKDKDVMVDNAKVTKTDVACSNGVIHMIDTVLMPKEGNAKGEEKKKGHD